MKHPSDDEWEAVPGKMQAPMRVCVVGSGLAGLAAAYRLAKHGNGNVQVTLVSTTPLPAPAGQPGAALPSVGEGMCGADVDACEGPITGVLSRHGSPNISRWCDELEVSLGFYDATVTGVATQPSKIQKRKAGASVQVLVARELQHNANTGLSAPADKAALDGTLAQFCTREGFPDAVTHGWLLPLAASVWGIPLSDAAAMSARLALRVLFENGLLLPGGDGSGDPATWWPLRPRGGNAILRRRAISWLRAHDSVRLVCTDGVQPLVSPADDGGHGANVEFGSTGLGAFEHVVLALDPATSARAVAGGMKGHQWEVALRSLDRSCSIPMEATLTRKPPECVDARKILLSSTIVADPASDDGVSAGSNTVLVHRVRSLAQEAFGMEPVDEEFVTMRRKAAGEGARASGVVPVQAGAMGVECEAAQRAIFALQGAGGVWYASSLLCDGLHEGSVLSALRVVSSLLPQRPVPVDVPAWRGQLHLRFSGHTTHKRPKNARSRATHKFQYDVRYDYVNVDAGFQRWWGGLVREDHFGDPDIALGESVRRLVAKRLGVWPQGPIDLLGSLREWGYCFNPICLYYCWASPKRERLLCVVSEVTNTPWGQRSLHVLPIDLQLSKAPGCDTEQQSANLEGAEIEGRESLQLHALRRGKVLHVSPFNPPPDGMSSWRYNISKPTPALERLWVSVGAYADAAQSRDSMQVLATLGLQRQASRGVLTEWMRTPYALLVQLKIHYQAALLWKKGLTFYSNTTCPLARTNGSISHGSLALISLASVTATAAGIAFLAVKFAALLKK